MIGRPSGCSAIHRPHLRAHRVEQQIRIAGACAPRACAAAARRSSTASRRAGIGCGPQAGIPRVGDDADDRDLGRPRCSTSVRAGGRSSTPSRSRAPIGLSPAGHSFAAASLMTATRSPRRTSAASNIRPRAQRNAERPQVIGADQIDRDRACDSSAVWPTIVNGRLRPAERQPEGRRLDAGQTRRRARAAPARSGCAARASRISPAAAARPPAARDRRLMPVSMLCRAKNVRTVRPALTSSTTDSATSTTTSRLRVRPPLRCRRRCSGSPSAHR